ncbi:hypothetical protein [Ruegeria lacuscaerulensis]|uniref:hypothetical protein n=1 Tax=Ruegeria lacuscaerulensis TaxID=55218 RepID=UPI00147A5E60|nr:hypothetical protein [Ruegeria lacuscaerulensis]
MVTKAELEAEVAALRRQLAEQSAATNTATSQKQKETTEAEEKVGDRITDNFEAWSTQLEDVLTELEDLPHKKPILFALGIFALGYLLGRSR